MKMEDSIEPGLDEALCNRDADGASQSGGVYFGATAWSGWQIFEKYLETKHWFCE
jgi:hypothetical protein